MNTAEEMVYKDFDCFPSGKKPLFIDAKEKTVSKFESLSFELQKQHFMDVAKRALPLWGYPENSKLTLLNITENATYRVDHPDFETIIMRVHRLVYAEKESIQTEISWILDLKKDTRLNLATPLEAMNGEYVQTIDTVALKEKRNVVCFSYLRGTAPKDSHDDLGKVGDIISVVSKIPSRITIPLFIFAAVISDKLSTMHKSKKESLTQGDIEIYHKIGEIAATIHCRSKEWIPAESYKRMEWDWNGTFGADWNNFYGTQYGDIKGILSASDIKTIDSCVSLMRKRIDAFGKSSDRYGMIHSDLRLANLLKDDDTISVLDFDDCGKGWYMYDIAGIVGLMEDQPNLQEIINVIVEGYRSRTPLSDEDVREIPTFIMMRRIGLLQAIIYHIDNTDVGSGESAEITPEILAYFAKSTAILAKKYIKNFSLMS